MRIGIVTYAKAPYRNSQWEEISKSYKLKIYYTGKNIEGRGWEVEKLKGIEEKGLKVIKKFGKYGYLNKGLIKVVQENDCILLGGYEHPSYIILSILCRMYKKPFFLLYDGISPKKIGMKENKIKYLLKKLVINNAHGFFANGTVGKEYFIENFNIRKEKIFNQVLSVDNETIQQISCSKEVIKRELVRKYDIQKFKHIIIYSGRLLKSKNVYSIIESISLLDNKEKYLLLILGDGEEKENLRLLAENLGVNIRITGFISNQKELFKHYYLGDLLVLPSSNEVWGLVVNEAMAAGLPVVVSTECGCVKDLVIENFNGYTFPPKDVITLAKILERILLKEDKEGLGRNSLELIEEWNFKKSAQNFKHMIEKLGNKQAN
ncbi:glycosyltransferase [Priestia megaterium]|uniref:glycosyltransferase n=1 Tax=Priestia megaterium TaxID=1404 RepID=UPI000BA61BDD|nr:glycosyltransferase [Priestia megaterium]PAK49090.1 glycosyltransferase [Priestia megaterium]PEZ12508.1 glycosyltransferase [Priestia megaterium]